MKRLPEGQPLTPEEWDHARFAQSYWAGAIALLAMVVVCTSLTLTKWYRWTGGETAVLLFGLISGWLLFAFVGFAVWRRARARARRRRGGRR